MDPGNRWIAVAVLPNGKRISKTFSFKRQLKRFVDKVLKEHPDARILYAIPSVVTRNTRAR
jgi:hypothetical protein